MENVGCPQIKTENLQSEQFSSLQSKSLQEIIHKQGQSSKKIKYTITNKQKEMSCQDRQTYFTLNFERFIFYQNTKNKLNINCKFKLDSRNL